MAQVITGAGLAYRSIPASFNNYPLLRSYAAVVDGRMHRVEVRKDPVSGHQVQVARPMPDTLNSHNSNTRGFQSEDE